MSMVSGLTTWCQLVNGGCLTHGRIQFVVFFSLSLNSYQFPVFLCLGLEHYEISYTNIRFPTPILTCLLELSLFSLVQATILSRFHGWDFPDISRRHSHSRHCVLSTVFPFLLPQCPLCAGARQQMQHLGLATIWSLVFCILIGCSFCNDHQLLQKDVSLLRGENYTLSPLAFAGSGLVDPLCLT